MRKFSVLIAVLLCLASAAFGQTTKTYLIVAHGEGKGSTAFAANLGSALVADLEQIGVVVAQSSDPNFAKWALSQPGVQQVAEDPQIQWINHETSVAADEAALQPAGLNSEPYSGYQWNMRVIGADRTAAAGFLGAGARVAVLDAGMITKHPDIAANIDLASAISFVPGEGVDPVNPGFNHGTHVAGIIAAAINNMGTQGVAPRAQIVPVKVLSESGSGSFSWLIQGLVYTADKLNVDVVNMSLGAVFPVNPNAICDPVNNIQCGVSAGLISGLNRAITYATRHNVLCVSAAGNDGVNLNNMLLSVPAQSGNGIAVAATAPYNQTNFDGRASYSNYGQSVVDLAAPGGDYASGNVLDYVLAPGGFSVSSTGRISYGYYFAVGTSMATPHVSGLAALIVGKYGHGKLTPAQITAIMSTTATDIFKPGADPYSGAGRINAFAAVNAH